jgi:hypothetical protein
MTAAIAKPVTVRLRGEPRAGVARSRSRHGLRPRLGQATIVSVVDSLASRNAILASGMDVGVREGYEQLDNLLTTI